MDGAALVCNAHATKLPTPHAGNCQGSTHASAARVGMMTNVAVYPNIDDIASSVSRA